MAIVFHCYRCDQKYSVPEAMAGRRVVCKKCRQEFNVPQPSASQPLEDFDEIEEDEDGFDDGPPIAVAPPRRTINPASFLPPGVRPSAEDDDEDDLPPPPRVGKPRWSDSPRSSGGSPDLATTLTRAAVAVVAFVVAGGAAWYVANHGLPGLGAFGGGDTARAREVIATIKEYQVLLNAMADDLEGVHDAVSAQQLALRWPEKERHEREIGERLKTMRTSRAEDRYIYKTMAPSMRATLARVKAHAQRIVAMPGGNPMAGNAWLAQIDRLIAIWNDDSRFGGSGSNADSGPKPGSGGSSSVPRDLTIDVSGLADDAERELVGEKLRNLTGARSVMISGDGGGRSRFQIEAPEGAKSLSERIDFGKVTKVTDDWIGVTAELSAAEVGPYREKFAARKAEEAERRRKAEEDRRVREAANTPPALAKTYDPKASPIDRALAETRSPDRQVMKEAIKRLAYGVPADRRAEVAEALIPLVRMEDIFTVNEVVRTLAKLKAREAVPVLVEQLERTFVDGEAAKALGAIGGPEAAEALAERLDKFSGHIREGLIAMGADAEPVVMQKLRDPDKDVRSHALEILSDIGTKATLKLMLTLPADPDPLVRLRANDTMRKIIDRVGPLTPAERKGGVGPGDDSGSAPSSTPKKGESPFRKRK